MFNITTVFSANYYTNREHNIEYYTEENKVLGEIVDVGYGKRFFDDRKVTAKDLKALSENWSGRKRFGFDLTFSAPKEVSVLYSLTQQESILQAHREAVKTTLQEISKYIYTRDRSKEAQALNLIYQHADALFVRFDHFLNRNLEPNLHSHVLLFNQVKRKGDSQLRAVEPLKIYENQRLFDAIYKFELAKNLQKLGYNVKVELKENEKGEKYFDISFQNESLKEYASNLSSRRKEILEKMAEFEKTGIKNAAEAEDLAAKITRARKISIDIEKHFQKIKNEFENKYNTVEDLLKQITTSENEKKKNTLDLKQLIRESINILEKTESANSLEKVFLTSFEIASLNENIITLAELEKAFKEMKKHREVKLYDLINKGIEENYVSSKTQTELEKENIQIINSLKNTQEKIYSCAEINELIESFEKKKGFSLSEGQKEAVEKTLLSEDSVIIWQGRAGAGKTTAIELVAQAFEKKGYKVIGLAPTGKAAEVLQESVSQAYTIHSFLQKPQPIDEKTVLIVDESSMLSSQLANQLLKLLQQTKARAVFVGDISQLQSVEAGRFFQDIQKYSETKIARISEIQRQKREDYRELTKALAEKDFEKALKILEKKNNIKEEKNIEKLISRVVEDYLQTVREGENNILVVTRTNEVKDRLNSEIRNALKEQGFLKEEEVSMEVFTPKNLSPLEQKFTRFYKKGDIIRFNTLKDLKTSISQEIPIAVLKVVGKEFQVKGINAEKNTLLLSSLKNPTIEFELNLNRHAERFTVWERKKLQIQVGDKIMSLQNNSNLNLKNGQIWTVQYIKDGKLYLTGQNGKVKEISLSQYSYFDYAYACTVHKAQGTTVNKIIHISEGKSSYNEVYTALTRGRNDFVVYTTNKQQYLISMKMEENKTSTIEFNEEQKKQVERFKLKLREWKEKISFSNVLQFKLLFEYLKMKDTISEEGSKMLSFEKIYSDASKFVSFDIQIAQEAWKNYMKEKLQEILKNRKDKLDVKTIAKLLKITIPEAQLLISICQTGTLHSQYKKYPTVSIKEILLKILQKAEQEKQKKKEETIRRQSKKQKPSPLPQPL